MRQHLHLLKGASLAVFMAISLHADRDGFAFPSVPTLCRETGYNKDAVFKALTHLRDLKIDGHRVLCSVQRPGEKGKFASNGYLIFPSAEQAASYDAGKAVRDEHHAGIARSKNANSVISPHTCFPDAVKPDAEKPDTAEPDAEKADAKKSQRELPPVETKPTYKKTPAATMSAPDPAPVDAVVVAPQKIEVSNADQTAPLTKAERDVLCDELAELAVDMRVGVTYDSAWSTINEALKQRGEGHEDRVRRNIAWFPTSSACKNADSPGAVFRVAVRGDLAKNDKEAKSAKAADKKQKEASRRYVQAPKRDDDGPHDGLFQPVGLIAENALQQEFSDEAIAEAASTLSECAQARLSTAAIERASLKTRPGTAAYNEVESAKKGFLPIKSGGQLIRVARKEIMIERMRNPIYVNGKAYYDPADAKAAQIELDCN